MVPIFDRILKRSCVFVSLQVDEIGDRSAGPTVLTLRLKRFIIKATLPGSYRNQRATTRKRTVHNVSAACGRKKETSRRNARSSEDPKLRRSHLIKKPEAQQNRIEAPSYRRGLFRRCAPLNWVFVSGRVSGRDGRPESQLNL